MAILVLSKETLSQIRREADYLQKMHPLQRQFRQQPHLWTGIS